MTGVTVKGKVAVLVGPPLPQLVRQDEVAAGLEFRFLDQAGVVAVGGVVPAAVGALHRVVPAAPIGHIGDIGGARRGIKGIVTVLDVDCAVALLPDLYRLDLGHPLVFADGVHGRLVAVSLSALGFIVGRTHNNVIADAEISRLGGGQQDALDAALADGRRILQVLRAVPLDRAAVALDAVLEPDHGQLPFQQVSARARVLTAALAPQRYVVVVGAVVDRGQAGAAPDGAVVLQARAVFGVGHVRVDVVLTVGALGPGLPALGGVALHLEVTVAAFVPLPGVGVFLEHPHQMPPIVRAAGADHIQGVDELAGVDSVGAVGVFLGRDLAAPKLCQVCKVVPLGLGLGGGLTDKAHAVVGLFAGGALTGRKQRQLDAVDAVIVEDVAKPAGQHTVIAALALHPLAVPPVHKELVQLGLGSALVGEDVVQGVNLSVADISGRPLWPSVSFVTLGSLRTGVARVTLRPLRTGVTRVTLRPLRTGVTRVTLRPLRTGVARVTLRPLRTGVARVALRARVTLLCKLRPALRVRSRLYPAHRLIADPASTVHTHNVDFGILVCVVIFAPGHRCDLANFCFRHLRSPPNSLLRLR